MTSFPDCILDCRKVGKKTRCCFQVLFCINCTGCHFEQSRDIQMLWKEPWPKITVCQASFTYNFGHCMKFPGLPQQCPQLGAWTLLKCTVPHFWRLQVWDQGASRAVFLQTLQGPVLLTSSSFRWMPQSLGVLDLQLYHFCLCLCLHTASSLCRHLCCFSSSYKDTVILESGPALRQCDLVLTWLHLQKLYFQISPIQRYRAEDFKICFWGDCC